MTTSATFELASVTKRYDDTVALLRWRRTKFESDAGDGMA